MANTVYLVAGLEPRDGLPDLHDNPRPVTADDRPRGSDAVDMVVISSIQGESPRFRDNVFVSELGVGHAGSEFGAAGTGDLDCRSSAGCHSDEWKVYIQLCIMALASLE